MVLIPESPTFHLMKGNVEKARMSLRYFRGPYGTVDQELSILQDSLAKVYKHICHYICRDILNNYYLCVQIKINRLTNN